MGVISVTILKRIYTARFAFVKDRLHPVFLSLKEYLCGMKKEMIVETAIAEITENNKSSENQINGSAKNKTNKIIELTNISKSFDGEKVLTKSK